jgi:hypothetical protein
MERHGEWIMAANKKANAAAPVAPSLTSVINGGYVTTSTTGPVYYTGGGGGYGGGGTGFGGGNTAIGVGSWGSQISPNTNITGALLELNGDKADIKINGVSLNDTLTAIQKKLDILTVNPKLENEWDDLKALGEQYRKLETELAEKSKMWAALKKTE